MQRTALCIICCFSIFGVLVSQAQTDGDWIKIADKVVNFKAEKDVVTPKGDERRVDKIRIKCIQGTVRIRKVTVEMSNGERKEYDAKGTGVLSKGMTSFSWDLPGNGSDNKVKKIELEYDSMGNMVISKKAHVEVEGRLKKDN